MKDLHGEHLPTLYNNLNVENVLIKGSTEGPKLDAYGRYNVKVADYKCLLEVVEIGFWRGREILQQLMNRVPMSKMVFTKKCHIYNYGVTCNELVSGHLPFEGHLFSNYNTVLNRGRSQLPPDVEPLFKEIITSC